MSAQSIRMIFAAGLMVLTAAISATLRPATIAEPRAPDLSAMMPEDFAAWRRIEVSQAVLPPEAELGPGEAVVFRAYKDELGRVVTLVAAYGPPLGDSVRLHRPEICYVSQGFEILGRSERMVALRDRAVAVVELQTQSPSRREAVSYWLREGRGFTVSSSDNALRRLKGAAAPVDSALIRISSAGGAPENFNIHLQFMRDFTAALSEEAAALFIGGDAAS